MTIIQKKNISCHETFKVWKGITKTCRKSITPLCHRWGHAQGPVMNKNQNMDKMIIRIYLDATICTEKIFKYIRMPYYVPNKYPNIFGCHIMYQTNIWIYLDATLCTEQISEYIRMPHYVPYKYPNIFGCHIFTERISEYICTPEIAQIRIRLIFKGHFIKILKYLYSSLIEEIFKRAHSCFL